MFEAYTEKAKSVLKEAEKISRELNQNYVGTEHILLGLLREKSCAASQLLAERKAEEKNILQLIEELISPEHSVRQKERPGFTPRARRVLEEAAQEAARFKEQKVGTEHILIAMLKDVECTGSRLLTTMDINVKGLYAALLDSMGKTGREYREEMARNGRNQGRGTQTLDQYSRDLTKLAREKRL